jgi:hypothetical protein
MSTSVYLLCLPLSTFVYLCTYAFFLTVDVYLCLPLFTSVYVYAVFSTFDVYLCLPLSTCIYAVFPVLSVCILLLVSMSLLSLIVIYLLPDGSIFVSFSLLPYFRFFFSVFVDLLPCLSILSFTISVQLAPFFLSCLMLLTTFLRFVALLLCLFTQFLTNLYCISRPFVSVPSVQTVIEHPSLPYSASGSFPFCSFCFCSAVSFFFPSIFRVLFSVSLSGSLQQPVHLFTPTLANYLSLAI